MTPSIFGTGELIRPAALKPGDTIAVIAPSSPGPVRFPLPFRRGLAQLRGLGYRVKEMPNIREFGRGWVADAKSRADDLHEALADGEVRGIISVIGGNHASQILPLLDLDLIKRNPKIFCGYSDATALHCAFLRAGVVSFYGPALVPQWGVVGGPLPQVVEHFQRVLGVAQPAGLLPRWAYEIHDSDFALSERQGRPLTRVSARPRRAAQSGTACGPLIVACLPSLCSLLGTPWEPDWQGKVLVLETPGSSFGIPDADAQFTHLRLAGVFAEIAALGICRPYGWTEDAADLLTQLAIGHLANDSVPVIDLLEGGHTDPLPTYPLGVMVKIRGTEFTIMEPAVADLCSTERGKCS